MELTTPLCTSLRARPQPKPRADTDILVTIPTFPSFTWAGRPCYSLAECQETPGAVTHTQEPLSHSRPERGQLPPHEALAEPEGVC